MTWPPTLDELKTDMGVTDTRDDARLQLVLDASVAFVQRVRSDLEYASDSTTGKPEPGGDVRLGTLRLASRWHTRRRSPDALVTMGVEMGSARVPSLDPDIERLLRIGRHVRPMVG